MKIDLEYLTFGLTVGVRNRVAIYNHIRTFLFESIAGYGFAVEDQALFNHLTIEQQAMRLTDEAIAEAESRLADIFSEMGIESNEAAARQLAAATLMETIESITSNFLSDDLFGLTWLIHDASGVAPATPEGGISMDLSMTYGPDRDRDA
jgi:hypothetical protein